MKKVLLFLALFLFVFGVFVRLGKKNFPVYNNVAVEAFSGVVSSLNPYNLPTSDCIELETPEGVIIRPVVSFRDFSVSGRKVAVSDTIILYAWNNNLYPATSKIDWAVFSQKVNKEASMVCNFCLALALFLCILGAKIYSFKT